MVSITTNMGVQVKGGPQLSIPPVLVEVDAYDNIELTLQPVGSDGSGITVDVQPGNSGVSFLLILSSVYSGADGTITFQVGDKPEINLAAPQLYVGEDTISKLLGPANIITMKNTFPTAPPASPPTDPSADPPADLPANSFTPTIADISILVGRKAIKPPANPA